MLGLSDIMAGMVHSLRATELDLSKQYRRLLTIQTFIGRLRRLAIPRFQHIVMMLLLTLLAE